MNLKSRHFVCVFLINAVLGTSTSAVGFVGAIVDDATGKPIAARVYVQNANSGEFLFVETDSDDGSALPYREQWVPMENSIERHTTVSAHPFRVDLAPGRYSLIVERGKEYSTFVREVTIAVGDSTRRETVRLKRWANMAARGWYSGETHVHRRIPELPNVMLAEDLNVAVPVTFWTTNAYEAPHLKPSTLRSQGPSP
ncbi:MAG: carboxypeptidase regulatory-like domain-containing protein [Planctomycetales bacterium]|nr:carboxypeptidase regulatory-like domain-containing protein [Planctomycetales bacterium]